MALRRTAPDDRRPRVGGLRRGSRGAPRRCGAARRRATSRRAARRAPSGRDRPRRARTAGGARARADCDRAAGERHALRQRRRRRDARGRRGARRSASVRAGRAGRRRRGSTTRTLPDGCATPAQRGWNVTAAVVEADDAVLIGNRFDRSLPIVDEVADAASLPLGARAAVEVAEPGASVEQLSDPLRLGVLLGFGPEEARAARTAARALAGHRAALVVRVPRSAATGSAPTELSIVLVDSDGDEKTLDERASPPPPGAVAAIRGAAGDRDGLLDVYWHPLPVPADDPGLRPPPHSPPRRRARAPRARREQRARRGDRSPLPRWRARRRPRVGRGRAGRVDDTGSRPRAVRPRPRRRNRRPAPRRGRSLDRRGAATS